MDSIPDEVVEQYQDVSELLQTGEPIILSVDQVPFEVESRGVKNTFCLLVPLMTEGGLQLRREQFRNRERVWWMLRSDIAPEHIQVGSVWSGAIERSRAYGNTEKEKDHYQVRRADIRPAARGFVEVLNLKVTHPDLAELLSPEGIPWPYRPLPRVVVRGGLSVVGPFRTTYDPDSSRLLLQSLTLGEPLVYRLSRSEFETHLGLIDFGYTANQWDSKAQERRIDLTLFHERELSYLEEHGEQLDGATDAQVVNWALTLMEIPQEERQLFTNIFERAGELAHRVETRDLPGRTQRFLKLCENRDRIIELGSEVAAALSSREGFRDLINRHIDQLTAERVSDAIERRGSEIVASTEEAESRLERIRGLIESLDEEYGRRVETMEQEVSRLHGERIAQIEEREAAIERREKEMRARLQGLVNTYRREAKTVTDNLVAQIPLMQRLGMLDPGGGLAAGPAAGRSRGEGGNTLELPQFLREPRVRSEMDEEDFLDQFKGVVSRRGFFFDHEDLINFHVLVKTGLWTVLTGPSGLGKSSLPRLYAESLGCLDEFLFIPVRPDWLDDRDVIGSFNALTGRYEPAPCGLVERLIAAYEDARSSRGGLYVVCLDEMNLARVEHYFAQFISILEQPSAQRKLQLFARGTLDPGDSYASYRELPLGANIRLVGTVNVDETTHFFSPKVLDRVSISAFERPDLRLGLEQGDRSPGSGAVDPIHLENYLDWMRPPDREGEVVELILKIDDVLRRSRMGLGFRLRDRLLHFISSARPLLGEDRAIDLAVLQNVLPGLRPLAPRYMELLKELESLLPPGRFRRSAQMLQALQEDPESDFFQLL